MDLTRFQGAIGIVAFLLICWALSTNRRKVQWRVIIWGMGMQFVFAYLVLRTTAGHALFDWLNDVFLALTNYTTAGASFVFGNLVWNNVPVGQGIAGTNIPLSGPGGTAAATGAFFAFQVLPTIIFFSSLMAILYHVRVMDKVVKGIAWVMYRTMRVSGAESLSNAANIFLGQTEAPLVVRPFIPKMTRSELMAIMVGGLANTAGGVLIAYIGFLKSSVPDIAGHLLAVSIMSAPAAFVAAKLLVPEEGEPETMGSIHHDVERVDANLFDAAARGASEGMQLALNVGAMLIAFLALLALFNGALDAIGRGLFDIADYVRDAANNVVMQDGVAQRVPLADGSPSAPLSLSLIFSYVFWPLGWLMGVAAQDCRMMGNLLGLKTFANEFIAYAELAKPEIHGPMTERSRIIASYALCGFANVGSIGILLGGLSPLAPERRHDLAKLGLRALVGGSIATFLCACVAGLLLTESDLFPTPAETPAAVVSQALPSSPEIHLLASSEFMASPASP